MLKTLVKSSNQSNSFNFLLYSGLSLESSFLLTETTKDILSSKTVMYGGKVTYDFWLQSPTKITEGPAVKVKSEWFYTNFRPFSSNVHREIKGTGFFRGFLGLISCDRCLWASVTNNGSVCLSNVHAGEESGEPGHSETAGDSKHCFRLAGDCWAGSFNN